LGAVVRALGLLAAVLVIPACARNKTAAAILLAPSPGILEFADAAPVVNENAGTAVITVRRSGGSLGAVGVTYATSNGPATASGDYTSATGVLSWAEECRLRNHPSRQVFETLSDEIVPRKQLQTLHHGIS